MKKSNLRSSYDKEADAGYISLGDIANGEAVTQVVVEDKRLRGTIILDLDSSNQLLGIEFLDVTELIRSPSVL